MLTRPTHMRRSEAQCANGAASSVLMGRQRWRVTTMALAHSHNHQQPQQRSAPGTRAKAARRTAPLGAKRASLVEPHCPGQKPPFSAVKPPHTHTKSPHKMGFRRETLRALNCPRADRVRRRPEPCREQLRARDHPAHRQPPPRAAVGAEGCALHAAAAGWVRVPGAVARVGRAGRLVPLPGPRIAVFGRYAPYAPIYKSPTQNGL